MRTLRLAACLLVLTVTQQADASIIVQTVDFISNSDRTQFNGFEAITPIGSFYSSSAGPYIEDSIQVRQVNGDPGNDIWVNYTSWAGSNGRVWYPNGGDYGYTEISMADDTEFQDVGFNYASGSRRPVILYELLQDGVIVLSGSAAISSGINYLGFTGGRFDTIRVRDTISLTGHSVTDHGFQSLVIDNIETHRVPPPPNLVTPEPSSIVLLGLGLAGMGFGTRIRRRKQG